jgi:hypothetical protein
MAVMWCQTSRTSHVKADKVPQLIGGQGSLNSIDPGMTPRRINGRRCQTCDYSPRSRAARRRPGHDADPGRRLIHVTARDCFQNR